ncbi:hypothetical protein [Burkholderia sp. GbtcB21]|uniref:hypothetical protein n=1 Tax=Burkholderia sp. GbtcB21 TaxID=2824766 RepID=UPI001C303A1D|nr:hypothetical protein [Burkholderia sp. GbtcB21]
MRAPLTTGRDALRARLSEPGQVPAAAPESGMPPYMESFLAHLRLLVGVPFEYLIPDPRLLPDESIRFFYLDRSWTDRLVDGAVTVGKIGSREQAHHQGHADAVSRTLDVSERMVRSLQRGREGFETIRAKTFAGTPPSADLVTGFVLRSGTVSGWPHMDVRAYTERIPEPFDASSDHAISKQLALLRLERLSPGVLFALFEGVPVLVTLEEPHHGIQFGVDVSSDGSSATVPLRTKTGQLLVKGGRAVPVPLPRRARRQDVIDIKRLRDQLAAKAGTEIDDTGQTPIVQSGSAAFAIAVLDPPWRQRFEGTEDLAGEPPAPTQPRVLGVSQRVRQVALKMAVETAFGPKGK